MDKSNITDEDRIAMADAYRVYELLSLEEQQDVPEDFINTLLYYGDFKNATPINSVEEALKEGRLSKKAMYLIMYMCTF
jgi:hypothetical protein